MANKIISYSEKPLPAHSRRGLESLVRKITKGMPHPISYLFLLLAHLVAAAADPNLDLEQHNGQYSETNNTEPSDDQPHYRHPNDDQSQDHFTIIFAVTLGVIGWGGALLKCYFNNRVSNNDAEEYNLELGAVPTDSLSLSSFNDASTPEAVTMPEYLKPILIAEWKKLLTNEVFYNMINGSIDGSAIKQIDEFVKQLITPKKNESGAIVEAGLNPRIAECCFRLKPLKKPPFVLLSTGHFYTKKDILQQLERSGQKKCPLTGEAYTNTFESEALDKVLRIIYLAFFELSAEQLTPYLPTESDPGHILSISNHRFIQLLNLFITFRADDDKENKIKIILDLSHRIGNDMANDDDFNLIYDNLLHEPTLPLIEALHGKIDDPKHITTILRELSLSATSKTAFGVSVVPTRDPDLLAFIRSLPKKNSSNLDKILTWIKEKKATIYASSVAILF